MYLGVYATVSLLLMQTSEGWGGIQKLHGCNKLDPLHNQFQVQHAPNYRLTYIRPKKYTAFGLDTIGCEVSV